MTKVAYDRGGKVWIPMWCEAGHAWDVVVMEHKGQTFMYYGNVRAQNGDEPANEETGR